MKLYLIANLDNEEFNNFYIKKMKKKINSTGDIIELIKECSIEELVKVVRRV